MKNKIIIIITIVVMASASCGKTYCPAFPPHLMDYYPYHVGDILKFTNSANDTIAMKVNSVDTSVEESFGFGCDCACGFYHNFTTEIDPLLLEQIFMSGGMYGDEDYIRIAFGIADPHNGNEFYLIKEDINPFAPENSNIFGDTLIFENDKATKYNKITIVKGEGAIEFFDPKNNCTWKKVKE